LHQLEISSLFVIWLTLWWVVRECFCGLPFCMVVLTFSFSIVFQVRFVDLSYWWHWFKRTCFDYHRCLFHERIVDDLHGV
jgi:hypothetical protein